jgi:hypothetical protein
MRTLALSLLSLVVLTPAARAQDFEKAGKLFAAAQESFGKKHYSSAATLFQSAYDITKDPILLYNVAESWEKAGDGKQAVSSYEAYLKAQPKAADKAEVQKRLKAIRAKKQKLPNQSAPGDDPKAALAALTPPPAPPAPPEPPPPPPPEPAPAPKPEAQTELVKPSFDTPPPAKPAPPPPEALPKKEEPQLAIIDDKPPSKMRVAAWVGVAVTVAVLTAGAILSLAAQSRADEISRRFKFVDSMGQPKMFDATQENDYNNLKNEGELYNSLGIGFFSAAGAAAVATTVLFAVDYVRGKNASKASALRLSPTFDRNGAGVSLGWSF